MITKMDKYTFMVFHKDFDHFLKALRDLGMLHVVAKPYKGDEDHAELNKKLDLQRKFDEVIKFMAKVIRQEGIEEPAAATNLGIQKGVDLVNSIFDLRSKLEDLYQHKTRVAKEVNDMTPWGEFSKADLNKLHDVGYKIGFYTCQTSRFNEKWRTDYNAQLIEKVQSVTYFITITKSDTKVEIDAEKVRISDRTLSENKKELENTISQIKKIERELVDLSVSHIETLKNVRLEISKEFKFSEITIGTKKVAGDKLMLLEGWAPDERKQEINTYLDEQEAYYEVRKPVPDDNVPILLKNNAFSRLFEPICKLYMLPQYSELDLTPYFAPFFMIFFGLCLGDSGYGLFIALSVSLVKLLKKKSLSDEMKPILSLVQVLGVSTFFCGLLTGTFFGANIYDLHMPFIQKMKEAIFLDNNQMFNLSLIMGVIQIIFGMVLKGINRAIQFGKIYCVSTFGWVLLLMSVIFAELFPTVLPLFGTVHMVLVAVATVGIFFFNSPGKNIFLNVGLGLWDSYNMATGLLGDILSYVRLFALGLSGSILAGVFDSLAVGMSPDNIIVGPIVMTLIFVIGHSINMFMNVLGALVHPMRLTFVEFFKNSGYAGGGKQYSPFKN